MQMQGPLVLLLLLLLLRRALAPAVPARSTGKLTGPSCSMCPAGRHVAITHMLAALQLTQMLLLAWEMLTAIHMA
jgi:hypothetical protein